MLCVPENAQPGMSAYSVRRRQDPCCLRDLGKMTRAPLETKKQGVLNMSIHKEAQTAVPL